MSPQLVIWLVTGIAVVVGVVWLISRAVDSGKKAPTPTTKPYDTQDTPHSDSGTSS
jgi:hypothetical protein